ncbi:MAG: GntR family transcriptional regulator [Acidimicrobiales bacterium]
MRELRYRAIAADLLGRLGADELAAGQVLPSEADLSRAYGASRVTVRRALEALRQQGLVDSRQGYGWFVAAAPVRQQLARLGSLESQLADSGVVPERRVLDFAFVPAPPRAEEVLGVPTVLQVRRLNLADGRPFARVTVWVPEHLGAHVSRADVERRSFYELLGLRLGGATQTVGAAAATAADARLLEVPVGSPMLRCERVTRTVDGPAVLLSVFLFPALRTEFVVELAAVESSIAPSGLRLV